MNAEVMFCCNWIQETIDINDIEEEVANPENKSIHIDDKETGVDNIVTDDVEHCECRKLSWMETFKCKDCRKHFCKECPIGPLEDQLQCLQCMFNDVMIVTSTPEKNEFENNHTRNLHNVSQNIEHF